MADQQSRGGKKVGQGHDQSSAKHQGTGAIPAPQHVEGVATRPAEGQPGGPKQGPKSGRAEMDASEQ